MASSTVTVCQNSIANVAALPAPEETKSLILEALKNGVKMTNDKVIRIWRMPSQHNIPGLKHTIVWIEEGTDKAGMQHILLHKDQFESKGILEAKIAEVAEAATTVGVLGGM